MLENVSAIIILATLYYPGSAAAQTSPVYLEQDGLVVIEAETLASGDWVSESSEAGFTGNGYLRWAGPNQFNEPGEGLIAIQIRIATPGEYNMRLRLSHLGAAQSDQENDCWTRMDGGPWIKTFHPGNRINEGFTFHSFHEPTSGEFASPRYTLDAGVHTFYISGRSTNLRVDRIHFYLDAVLDPLNPDLPPSPTQGSGTPPAPPEDPVGDSRISISGEQKRWHPVTLTLDGPQASETGSPNPFLDYRFEVVFSRDGNRYIVPGYFAADGNASETAADAGSKWRAHFVPDQPGTWSYETVFREGPDVAISDNPNAGSATTYHGITGSFIVSESDKTGRDFRSKGVLRYTGGHYLQFDNGEYFLKAGADSPENFLAYADFDGTYKYQGARALKNYSAHLDDWRVGDPSWQGEKGKGMIGALNYLAGKGMNAVYFITMNVEGDGKDVWPWTSHTDRLTYDVSKLDQWNIVFDHMDARGIMLHVLTQETENETLLNNGDLGRQRRLYYRELVARFSQHLAVTWNLGEENDNMSTAQRREAARYIRDLDPYDHPIVIHTFPGQYDDVYGPLLGYDHFEGPSLQVGQPEKTHDVVVEWVTRSAESGRRWIVSLDEVGPYNLGVLPDGPGNNHDMIRKRVLWATLMAGGAGVEWYFGYDHPHNDLTAEDWRSRDRMWDFTRHAVDFFQDHLPFHRMRSRDGLTQKSNDYVFAQDGMLYAVYLPDGGTTTIDLPDGSYSVQWYDPRSGGALRNGSVTALTGPGSPSLGQPPGQADQDWVALIRNTSNAPTAPALRISPAYLDFGGVQPGGDQTLSLTLSNTGSADLRLQDVSLSGEHANAFLILNYEEPLTLEPGGSVVLRVRFTPPGTGIYDAVLRLRSNDPSGPDVTVRLSGSGGDTASASVRVVGFTLVDVDQNVEIGTIEDGSVLRLEDVQSRRINIRADTEPRQVGSVQFALNNNNNFRMENTPPYAMAGDVGDTYNTWTPEPGEYQLTARPFTNKNGTGELGRTMTVTFQVEGEAASQQIEDLNNYPNPSNPVTTIRFALRKPGPTTLIVYDMLGKEVARLVDREMPRGNHHVSFDASNLASGVYLYRLQSRSESRVNKLIVVR